MARKNKAFDQSKYALWIDPQQAKPYERNAKEHTEKQIKNIANSIRRFGWQQDTVLTTDNVLVIGHGRRLAAIQLGCMMPYHVIDKTADELTDEDIRELRIADNQTNAETGLDLELLGAEIEDLDFDGFDFDFGVQKEASEVEDDFYDEKQPVEAKTKKGDIWGLGKHRLMCGDSTNQNDVDALMNGSTAKILFTSPPYADMREYGGGKDLTVEKLAKFIPAYKKCADFQCVNLGIKRNCGEIVQYWGKYIDEAKECGLKLLAWNVWDKLGAGSIGQQSAMIPVRHEWIFVFGQEAIDLNLTWEKKRSSIYSNGRRRKVRQPDGSMKESSCGVSNKGWKKMESVLDIPDQESLESVTKQTSEKGKIREKHPATFPIFLPAEYIIAFCQENENVVEPFGGSGTTLMACEQLGRNCFVMELDEHYCDVIIDRWQKFTGEKAVLLNGE